MSELVDQVVSVVLVALPQDRTPSEDEIQSMVKKLAKVFGVDEQGQVQVLQRVMSRRLVRMDKGYALFDRHIPWVDARRPQIDPYYWDRFKLYLQKELSPGVITGLDRSTDELLDLLGNPGESGTWKRRGLAMGDVQSGKTAAYSALICKAADAGYNFVVLLTGTIENLRRQTQERLDAGFVGFDSSEQLKRNGRNLRMGVGLLDGRRQATVFTSSSTDFRAATLEALGLSLDVLKEPALVVIKKNTRILANLRDWIRRYTPGAEEGQIPIPLLVIDDEADNASINTNDPEKDPTAVNTGIRQVLSMFRRTAYIGFTATPFANIFVNPDSKEDMLGDDLFPSDFIYTLQSPTNYFGPRRVFVDGIDGSGFLKTIDDAESALPSRHKSDHVVTGLPESLIDALYTFLISNAIRDLRGEGKTHRSMLVNTSQYTKVQDQIEGLLHVELEHIKIAIRNFAALPTTIALRDSRLNRLHATWYGQYGGCGVDWPSIQSALHDSVLPVTTRAVNQRTGPRALDYTAHRETGLRVIAVGGNSLSRGLTLEGLVISYFRRRTQMYDTLLQMGRWFGYRPGYEDLCRVWLESSTIDWYGHISDATDELRAELKRMSRAGRTPKDFGLVVRAHPDSLLVTARNKMRTASEITRVISLGGQSFESVELPSSVSVLHRNFESVGRFVHTLVSRVGLPIQDSGPILIRKANNLEVAELLRSFTVPATEFRFQPQEIAGLLEGLGGTALAEWDVAIPSGRGEVLSVGGVSVGSQVRAMRHEDPPGIVVVSGSKRRVGSRGGEAAGLSPDQKSAAETAARKFAEEEAGQPVPGPINVSDRFYRAERTRPLLLIHVLQGNPETTSLPLPATSRSIFAAIGLSFPPLENEPGAREVKYKINLVRARELFSSAQDSEDEDELLEEEC